eukprot:TRINITY_DN57481_c0_g1_i14.p1 TRINITY_DN57481_c0_g1~~TRINITY_DN57481_c0_g1_i14.p1  ORF type:complete len:412 (+),score=85.16 TRINITY_DN57481_c0_g1_i14:654-1889(+)
MSTSGSDVDSNADFAVEPTLDEGQEDHEVEETETTSPRGRGKGKGKGKGKGATRVASLTLEQREALLDFLKANTYLYNKAHPDYKDSNRRNRDWKDLADQLGLTVAVLQRHYKNLRTLLARAKRCQSTSGSGSLTPALAGILDELSFMHQYVCNLPLQCEYGAEMTTAAEPRVPDTELDPSQPGPSSAKKRRVAPSATVTSGALNRPPAAAEPAVVPVELPTLRRLDSVSSRGSASTRGTCCSQLSAQVGTMMDEMQLMRNVGNCFWAFIQSRAALFDEERHDLFRRDVSELMNKHIDAERQDKAQQLARTSSAGSTPSSSSGVPAGGLLPPQQVAPLVQPPLMAPTATAAIAGPATQPSFDSQIAVRISPRRTSTHRSAPGQSPQTTVCTQEIDFDYLSNIDYQGMSDLG